MNPSEFIESIKNKKKVTLTFFSKSDSIELTRLCAPMDYGPSQRRNIKDKSDKFHLWDYESEGTNHVLSLSKEQVIKIEYTNLDFNPAEFVTWPTKWIIKRNWGVYS